MFWPIMERLISALTRSIDVHLGNSVYHLLRSLLSSELGYAEYLGENKVVSTSKNRAQLDRMVQLAVNEHACFSQSVVSQF